MSQPQEARPMVSVAMITYNHEGFIGEAIESVLMQETEFPIELVIGEDCSTDKTREIVRHYAALRPDIVKPLLHPANVGAVANHQAVLRACRGTYIAFLEGDDYWVARDKLGRQVAFLEAHPGYSMSAHQIMHIFSGRPEKPPYASPPQKESGTLEDILRWNYAPTCSVVYRAGLVKQPPAWWNELAQGDWPLWVHLARQGKIAFHNEIMAHYRVHAGGIWSGAPIERKLAALDNVITSIHQHLPEPHPAALRSARFTMHMSGARQFSQLRMRRKGCARLVRAFANAPAAFVRSPEARTLVKQQLWFPGLVKGFSSVKRVYHRARIQAGAGRRTLFTKAKALFGR